MAEFSPAKADMDRLVLNYLIVEGYKDAAEQFLRESGQAPVVDLSAVEIRMKVRLRGTTSDACLFSSYIRA